MAVNSVFNGALTISTCTQPPCSTCSTWMSPVVGETVAVATGVAPVTGTTAVAVVLVEPELVGAGVLVVLPAAGVEVVAVVAAIVGVVPVAAGVEVVPPDAGVGVVAVVAATVAVVAEVAAVVAATVGVVAEVAATVGVVADVAALVAATVGVSTVVAATVGVVAEVAALVAATVGVVAPAAGVAVPVAPVTGTIAVVVPLEVESKVGATVLENATVLLKVARATKPKPSSIRTVIVESDFTSVRISKVKVSNPPEPVVKWATTGPAPVVPPGVMETAKVSLAGRLLNANVTSLPGLTPITVILGGPPAPKTVNADPINRSAMIARTKPTLRLTFDGWKCE
jgi:hypothetical protein